MSNTLSTSVNIIFSPFTLIIWYTIIIVFQYWTIFASLDHWNKPHLILYIIILTDYWNYFDNALLNILCLYSLEGLMLKLKLEYFGKLTWRMTHFKRPWCWERLKVGGEGDDRGWDGCMASPTQWTWFWVNSWSWWWIGRPGMPQSMGSQRVGHDWETELNWTDIQEG